MRVSLADDGALHERAVRRVPGAGLSVAELAPVGLAAGVTAPRGHDRPAIGVQCRHAGRAGEVRATFLTPAGWKVVGCYLDVEVRELFAVMWQDCTPAPAVPAYG